MLFPTKKLYKLSLQHLIGKNQQKGLWSALSVDGNIRSEALRWMISQLFASSFTLHPLNQSPLCMSQNESLFSNGLWPGTRLTSPKLRSDSTALPNDQCIYKKKKKMIAYFHCLSCDHQNCRTSNNQVAWTLVLQIESLY